ncbi:MAG: HAMP domain-containing sensor histidine kinase [Candidatus Nomurabacteria bacterium]|nr:HAMP domain-containing sensor histidine kinase [Candidatus Nomurabacteria bacterium]
MSEDIQKLKEENERLTKINSVKSEIVSIGAHQIRTSLAALKWIIKMFLDGDLGKLNTEQETLLRKAYDGNERAIGLVSEILLINKSEQVVEKEYVFEEINLVDIIEGTIFDFSGESTARGIEIIFLKPSTNGIPHVKADKEKIRVVFQNLIENAIKYSNYHGKIFISIKLNDDDFVQVSVKDSGIGISEDSKRQIFEKFYRTEKAQKKEAMGSGIGLYTTKKIVENHGGKVWFDSIEGHGTTFLFTVPVWEK